jgi:hypothetical protein
VSYERRRRTPRVPSVEIPLAVHGLEFTRVLAVPTEPLAAYACAMDFPLAAKLADRIGWTHGAPHPRVFTEGLRLVVGWAPIRLLADAIAEIAPAEARVLRGSAPSDVATWTLLHVTDAVTIASVDRTDLLSRFPLCSHATVPSLNDELPGGTREPVVFTDFPGVCPRDGGAHDVDGAPHVGFRAYRVMAFHACTCSKCGEDNNPFF